MYKFVKKYLVRNLLRSILTLTILLAGINGIHAQVTTGDFQYSSSITGSLQAPGRMAIDNNDNVYVIDTYTSNINKYDPAANLISTITLGFKPVSIAVNSYGEIFAGDATSGNIYKLSSNGASSLFYSGSAYPNGLSFSPSDQLYVSDSKLGKILVISNSGTLIQSIGQGTLNFPTGICYDRKNDRIVVGEQGATENNLQTRVYIYALDGTLINVLGSYGNTDGKFYRIQGITVGRCGNIYVCDAFLGRVSVYNENGTFITKFGEFGSGQGQLNVPLDVAFNSQEKVILSSMNNGSLELFSISDSLPSASVLSGLLFVCEGDSTDITIKFTGTSPWSFTYTRNNQNPITLNNISTNPYHLNVSQSGTYKVTALTDASTAGSCFSGSSTLNLVPNPIPDFNTTSNNLNISFVNVTQNAVSYSWDFGDNTTSNAMNPVHDYFAPGIYTVSLTAENQGCTKTIQKTISVGNASSIASITAASGMNVNISPNPCDGRFVLEINKLKGRMSCIEITNMNGQLIYNKVFSQSGSPATATEYTTTIDLGDFSNGVYVVKVITSDCTTSSKLILNK